MSALALPLQTSLAPRPDKPFDEEQKKNKDRDKRSDRQTGECDRKRHEKHGLNVEDQKDYGIEIILCVELNLRVADGFDAAFVGRSLVRAGFWRLEKSPPQPGQCQWDQRKHQRYANENDNEEIRVRIHACHLSGAKHELVVMSSEVETSRCTTYALFDEMESLASRTSSAALQPQVRSASLGMTEQPEIGFAQNGNVQYGRKDQIRSEDVTAKLIVLT